MKMLFLGALFLAGPAAAQTLDPARIKQDVRILSSDAFAGRGPAQPSEPKVIGYIADQMRRAGLRPAGLGGSWYQDVPMTRLTRGPVSISVRASGGTIPLRAGREVTAAPVKAGTTRIRGAPLVFGG